MSDHPRIGLYPGTFDPITNGHLDIIERASRVVDRLIVGVAHNAAKNALFNVATRVKMVEREISALDRHIVVISFDTLLMDFAKAHGASVIIRGLRAVSDFEYEIQMAAMNYRICPSIETIFLTAVEGTQFIASRFVKEIAQLGGDVRSFVSDETADDLKRHFVHNSTLKA